MSRLGATGDWACSLRLLRWMEERGAGAAEYPNEHSYAAFFSGCAAGASLEAARKVWRRLTADGRLPGARACTALLGALGRAGEVSEAVELLTRMAWDDVPRSRHAFNAVLSACAASGAWAPALEVWREQTTLMDDEHCRPDAFSLALILSACDRGGQWARGVAVATSPEAARIQLDAPAAGCLMAVAGRAGRPEVAHDVWARILGSQPRRIQLTPWLCNAYLSALAACGDADRARGVLATMRSQGVAPDVRSHTALMEVLSRQDGVAADARLVGVRAALADLLEAGLSPTETTLTVVLTALGDALQWREAIQLTDEWVARYGLSRNAYVFNVLMRACIRADQVRRAVDIFRQMQAARVLPSSVTFVLLIAGAMDAGLVDVAADLKALRASLTAANLLRDELAPVAGAEEALPPEESFAPGAWWEQEVRSAAARKQTLPVPRPSPRGRVQRQQRADNEAAPPPSTAARRKKAAPQPNDA